MAAEFIKVRHPDVEGAAWVSERAYYRLWKSKGWRQRLPADHDEPTDVEQQAADPTPDPATQHVPDQPPVATPPPNTEEF